MTMKKHKISQIKAAAKLIKDTCREHWDDYCDTCPLSMLDEWGEAECIMNIDSPDGWEIDKIGEALRDTEGGR